MCTYSVSGMVLDASHLLFCHLMLNLTLQDWEVSPEKPMLREIK